MMQLITSPEAWAALLTLTALEIVLGIDNVIFLSVLVSRIPQPQANRARQIGLLLALVFRIILLSLLVWLIGLTEPVVIVRSVELSWRDIILIAGGAFLLGWEDPDLPPPPQVLALGATLFIAGAWQLARLLRRPMPDDAEEVPGGPGKGAAAALGLAWIAAVIWGLRLVLLLRRA